MPRNPAFFLYCFLPLLFSGCGKPTGENFEWFRYAPPEGWEQRNLSQGVSMTMPGVAFHREGGDPRSPRLVIMDVSDHRARSERVAEVYLLGRERIARNQLKEAMPAGDAKMRYEAELENLSLPASESTKVVQVKRTIKGEPFGEWHAFLSLPGGGKVRVHFEALEPSFSELLPGVRESLQSLSFSKELTRVEAVDGAAAMDYFKSELNGERLWLSENRIDGVLPYLEGLPLRYIELQGTLVSPEGVERLKALKPGITVMYY